MGIALGEPVVSIAEELKTGKKEFVCPLREDEKVLFVYPVHSWGPAVPVTRFISGLKLTGYDKQPVYSISTCGDECGYTDDIMRKVLKKKGLILTDSYSVIMPNNYILLPGFDVDSKEVEQEKLKDAPSTVDTIVAAIRDGNPGLKKYCRSSSCNGLQGSANDAPSTVDTIVAAIRDGKNVNLYKKGSLPGLKSYCIYPLFANFAIGKNSFRVTDGCISCGLCERVCPTGTITLADGKPVWSDTCVQCVACIHRCPVRAIEYGKITLKKGRYHHPDTKQ